MTGGGGSISGVVSDGGTVSDIRRNSAAGGIRSNGGNIAAGDESGLNPKRQKGFAVSSNIETPRLTDMRAKQGSIVARFFTFAQRKSSLVVELYNAVFSCDEQLM